MEMKRISLDFLQQNSCWSRRTMNTLAVYLITQASIIPPQHAAFTLLAGLTCYGLEMDRIGLKIRPKLAKFPLFLFWAFVFMANISIFFSFTACCDLKLTSDYKLNCKYGSCSVKCRSGCQHVTDSADSGSCIAIKWANMLRSHICFIMDAMPNQPFILH